MFNSVPSASRNGNQDILYRFQVRKGWDNMAKKTSFWITRIFDCEEGALEYISKSEKYASTFLDCYKVN